jgi:phosphonate degradation associated HDIG domain protein
MQSRSIVDEVQRLFRERGDSNYGREAVTQLQHALQSAHFAEQDGAGAALVAAALLHDVGHLLHRLDDDAPDRGIDDRHEALAANWLRQRFGPDVVEPVALHVEAKRYLCTIEPSYLQSLSPPSVRSLELQGGRMNADELTRFERHPFFSEAVRLRRWDDAAKVVGLVTPSLEHFLPMIETAVPVGQAFQPDEPR